MTVFEGNVTTYGEMATRVTALATGLHERGIRPGQVVGLLSYNCPEFLETVFAANYLGADRHADQLEAGSARGALHP